MTEKTTKKEEVKVEDKRTMNSDGEVTLDGKSLADVQKEKVEKTFQVADEISTGDERKILKDEHFTKLENFTLKMGMLDREMRGLQQQAEAYFNQIAREYYPANTRVRLDLAGHSIIKVNTEDK